MHETACAREPSVILVLSTAVVSLFFSLASFADTIILKSGKSLDGAITECSDTDITFNVGGVSLTYYLEDITSINGMQPSIAVAQITGLSSVDKDSLREWERRYGMTVKDYWETRCAFEKARHDYDESIRALIRKYFSTNIQSLEDIHEKNITLPQGFVDEFKLIKHPPSKLAAKLKIPPPPGKPPQWCKELDK
jgi:hypothetical protein